MENKSIFKFKQFEIIQDSFVFKVGTDAILLGILTEINTQNNVLEIGTGTGIISLMLAQRFQNIKITAVEFDEKSYQIAKINFKNSPFFERLKLYKNTIQKFENKEKFDVIFCNPPFFEPSKNKLSNKHSHARNQLYLTYEELIFAFNKHLTNNGKATFIFPFEDIIQIENLLQKFNFFITKKWNIYGILNGKIKRIILEISKNQIKPEIYNFIIEKNHRIFTDEYLDKTKDFHVFDNKKLK